MKKYTKYVLFAVAGGVVVAILIVTILGALTLTPLAKHTYTLMCEDGAKVLFIATRTISEDLTLCSKK